MECSSVTIHPTAWQRQLRDAVSSVAELLALLHLRSSDLPLTPELAQDFPLRVPRGFIARMRRGDPHDPLLRQVLPVAAERQPVPGFLHDPVGDGLAERVPGVLHKYHGRALLVVTGACAIHCRYCFRRHFPYADSNPASEQWRPALDYLAGDTSITEIILSGGDPLSLIDSKLQVLVKQLALIPQLRRLRIHTRLPIVVPERITTALLHCLTTTRLQPVMVLHANHANEIDETVRQALQCLREAGIPLLNQAVLLRGVNDDAAVLADLSETLFAAGILPYYLHLLDRVQGAAHFEVDERRALGLMRTLRMRLPGYLVPRLVREIAGEPYKTPVEQDAFADRREAIR